MSHPNDDQISMRDWREDFTIEEAHVSNSNSTTDVQSDRRTNPRLLIKTIVDDSPKDLLPIIDYALEPLLPLRDACLPLSSIVSELESYVELALDKSRQPNDDLTQDELAAIYLYTVEWRSGQISLYTILNKALRNTSDRDELRPWYKYLKLFLTALAKLPFVPAQVVWRGVKRNISADFAPGSQIIWWSFSSCTTSLKVLESNLYLGGTGERTLFSIETINGKSIESYSAFNTEDEVLLLPGTYMEVQSQLNPAPDLYIIHLKQKIPQKILLAPPFNGADLYPKMELARPWYKTKICKFSTGIFMLICIAVVILGAVLVCKSRPFKITADILWSFDCSSVTDDIRGVYNGTTFNNITYVNPDFSGQGKALNLDSNYKQYVDIIPGNGTTRIGSPISSNTTYFLYAQTMLDQVSISYHLKNASELLREASLLFHYQFKNSSNIHDDSGPNAIQAHSQNVYYSQDGLYFNTTTSFFKTSEFTIIQLNGYTYSIAFWIQISDIDLLMDTQSILLFELKAKTSLGALEYSCFSYFYWQYNVFHYKLLRSQLGLTISTSNDTTHFEMNKWFHITVIDSPTNGIFIYVNGQLSGFDNTTSTISITYRLDMTLGTPIIDQSHPNNWPCFDSLIRAQWKGTMHDIRFYARQFDQSEILDIIKNQKMTSQK
ncbi:unnamed protein product [Rotaria sp. Silwood1]|nr:unnamed protein product [Rotaria sp. Silwood1]